MVNQQAVSAPESPAVEIRGLTVGYPVHGRCVRVLHQVDLAVGRGRTLALLGESGSGKSTLAKALLRLVPVEEGSILVDGTDVGRLAGGPLRHFRRRMQMVFQNAGESLTPTMTVGGLLRDTLQIHQRSHRPDGSDAAEHLLARVGLDAHLAERYPHELSGGQRQRVALARALAPDPDLLVLDEPLSALDVPAQEALLDLLATLKVQRRLSMLLITHHVDAARRLADEIAVMYAGRIVEHGPAGVVLARPAHPYTQALCAALPSLDPRQRALSTPPPVAEMAPPALGCAYRPRCPYAADICTSSSPVLATQGRADEAVQVACHVVSSQTGQQGG